MHFLQLPKELQPGGQSWPYSLRQGDSDTTARPEKTSKQDFHWYIKYQCNQQITHLLTYPTAMSKQFPC